MSRLVVVSNRVSPVTKNASAGGLAVGLQGALKKSGGLWLGWSGEVAETPGTQPQLTKAGGITYATLDLGLRDFDSYYNGYANSILWPLFHYRVDLATFNRDFYAGYGAVNEQFARALAPLLQPDDLIWVHDYHLIPLGEELRKIGCTQPLGFFLHIPFPVPEILCTLYNHRRLVRHLFAYDLVGFQTSRDVEAFREYAPREIAASILDDGKLSAHNFVTLAAAFPIGIDTENFAKLAVSAAAQGHAKRMTQSLADRRMIIGVDRLDYSKGLPQRFRAFETLLDRYPENVNNVSFIQIAPPSRSDVREYIDIREELATASGDINGRYAEFDWVPIRYINKAYGRAALAGMLRVADVGLVTPLRDGMNLVAMEYVAAQDPDDPGVLILSRFAGAAERLTEALIVNPHDVQEVADAMQRALEMPREERRRRWANMMERLKRENVAAWCDDFLLALQAAAEDRVSGNTATAG